MKRFVGFLVAILMLGASCSLAEITKPMGPGQIGFDAVVISKNVTVRASQNANSKSIKRLSYGDKFAAVSLGNGWCECYLSEDEGVSGYVLEDYVLLDPAYITTEESTAVYAWKATNAKRVGLLGRGETYPIIRTEGNWMLISLRGAAGWIVRPKADTTGTARMKTADVLERAQSYLLSTDQWAGNERVTATTVQNYYSFVEYDAYTREWLVTFSAKDGYVFEIVVDDGTGYAYMYDTVNG